MLNFLHLLNKKYSNDMEQAAQKVLEKCNITEMPVPIVKIMSDFGFKVIMQGYTEKSLSGIIGIDLKLMDSMGTDKVISVNKHDSLGHKRFTMAHELCHYIFDFDRNSLEPYYDAYDTERENEPSETRANKFAANLLMPKEIFVKKYKEYKELQEYDKAIRLSQDFQVSGTAIKRRMKELEECLGEDI